MNAQARGIHAKIFRIFKSLLGLLRRIVHAMSPHQKALGIDAVRRAGEERAKILVPVDG